MASGYFKATPSTIASSIASATLLQMPRLVNLLCIYLFHLSHTARATFAITSPRVTSSAVEPDTKTAIAKCRPSASFISPTSFVAAVTPSTVRDVPVLCATTVPSGNSPLIRFGPRSYRACQLFSCPSFDETREP